MLYTKSGKISVKEFKKKFSKPKSKKKKKIKIDKFKNLTYSQLLKTKQWQKVRNRILLRDKYTCQKCNFKMNLEVHHIKYKGKYPWQTPDKYLITLCEICHAKEHNKI